MSGSPARMPSPVTTECSAVGRVIVPSESRVVARRVTSSGAPEQARHMRALRGCAALERFACGLGDELGPQVLAYVEDAVVTERGAAMALQDNDPAGASGALGSMCAWAHVLHALRACWSEPRRATVERRVVSAASIDADGRANLARLLRVLATVRLEKP